MARTKLISFFRRLTAEHLEAERRGIAVERVRREQLLRRRDALKAIGVVAAVSAVSRTRSAFAAKGTPRIAIIGAGISGLNAALTLQDAGYASTVYEAATGVGGRMHSNTSTWTEGQVSEWCGELIDTGRAEMLALAERFKLPLDDLHAAEPHGSTETYYLGGAYYPYKQADKDFAPVLKVLNRQNNEAPFPTLYNSATDAGKLLDHTSVHDWIRLFVPGGHGSKLGELLDLAYNIEYGRDTKQQSSLNLVYLLPGPTKDLNVFGYSDETYHIRGGNQKLPLAIAKHLPNGSIKTSYRLTRLEKLADCKLRLTFKTATGTEYAVVDRVILTIPFSVLRTLDYAQAGFDALKKTAITELGYGTNVKLQLQFDERLWDKSGEPWPRSTGTSYADTGYQTSWDVTRAQPGGMGILVNYTGGLGRRRVQTRPAVQ